LGDAGVIVYVDNCHGFQRRREIKHIMKLLTEKQTLRCAEIAQDVSCWTFEYNHHHHILFAKKGGGLPEKPKLNINCKDC